MTLVICPDTDQLSWIEKRWQPVQCASIQAVVRLIADVNQNGGSMAKKRRYIIGAKYMSLTPKYWADVEAVQGKMRLLPLEVDWFLAHMLVPDRALACWSGSVICGPEPVLYLREALRRKDYDAARYHIMPSVYIEGARESGKRWRQLIQEVTGVSKNSSSR